jgi:hypothetical protein
VGKGKVKIVLDSVVLQLDHAKNPPEKEHSGGTFKIARLFPENQL